MSDKPLAERLQVKAGRKLAVIGADPALDQAIGASRQRTAVEEAEVVVLFTSDRAALSRHLPATLAALRQGAILWLAYPKLTSPLAGDLNRDALHALAPEYGLATVAQVAVDADWSALRLKRT